MKCIYQPRNSSMMKCGSTWSVQCVESSRTFSFAGFVQWHAFLEVIAMNQILLGRKTSNFYMTPTNSPTQGQPKPKKRWVRSGIWAAFSHSNFFFVGWDWFCIGNRLQKNQPNHILRKHPNQPTNQTINQLTKQPTNQRSHQAINISTNQLLLGGSFCSKCPIGSRVIHAALTYVFWVWFDVHHGVGMPELPLGRTSSLKGINNRSVLYPYQMHQLNTKKKETHHSHKHEAGR